MRLDHILISVYNTETLQKSFKTLRCRAAENALTALVIKLVINAGGHSGEAIPVPIPNTEVKLSYADDTALLRESR